MSKLNRAYQLFPALIPQELDALTTDIEARGVLVPVEVDETGTILDGHHRAMIADSLGIDYPTVIRSGLTEEEKLEHVFALNIARRQLNGHTRTMVIAECRHRGMSLRAIAKVVGVSHTAVRKTLTNRVAETKFPPDPDNGPADPEPELEPLPPPPTRAERIGALVEEGLTQYAIASELGISQATVSAVLTGRSNGAAAIPADWPHTKALLDEIKALQSKAPAPPLFAQAVPARNRASAARALRQVGTYLGSIALELERSI